MELLRGTSMILEQDPPATAPGNNCQLSSHFQTLKDFVQFCTVIDLSFDLIHHSLQTKNESI